MQDRTQGRRRVGFAVGLVMATAFLAGAQSGPAVTAISGDLSSGGTVTITGARFGTKPTGAPWKWDAMDGSNGQRLESKGWLVHQNTPQPILSAERVRPSTGSTAAAKMTQTGDNVPLFGFGNNDGGYLDFTSASVANYRPFPTPAFIDYWMYFHPPARSRNYKFFRHHANNASGSPNSYWGMPAPDNSPCAAFDWSATNGGLPSERDLGCPVIADKWVHVQMHFRTSNNGTGQFVQWIDGLRYFNVSNYSGESGSSQRANFLIESQQLDGTGDGIMYIDDVYIDNTYARVEVGNSAVYATATHRETQIPTVWADGSISVTLNRGSFPNFSGLYLFVVNGSGVASPGFAIGGSTPPPPPQPPGAPTGVSIAEQSTFVFSWTPPASVVTRYETRLRTADPWVDRGLPEGNRITITGLQNGSYRAQVRACNAAGCGAPSAAAAFTV